MVGRPRPWRTSVIGLGAALTLLAPTPGLAAQPAAGPPEVVGRWTQPFEEDGAAVPRCQPAGDHRPGGPGGGSGPGRTTCKPAAAEAAVLGDGRVLYFNGLESQENAEGPTPTSITPSARDSQARVLDLRAGPPRWSVPTWGATGGPAHPPTSPADDPAGNDGDLFCSDITTLPDGKLLMAGGADWYNEPSVMDGNEGGPADVGVGELKGVRNTWLFDPRSETFEPAAPMKYGRWYPHVAVGSDGYATVFGGVTQVVTGTQLGNVRRTETYHADSNSWVENYAGPESENTLPLQPRIVLAPNGQFFYAAVGQQWGPFGPAVDEAMTAFFQFFDPKTKKWSVSGLAPLGARSGAFVAPLTMEPPYEQMTLVTWGGVLGPTPGSWLPANPFTTLTSIDANGNVTNRNAGDLNHARWFSSGVLLPDGKVLAVGGTDKDDAFAPGFGLPVMTPELYDPQTTRWTEVAPHSRARGYHNSALLLPDMRVLVGGNAPLAAGYGGANQDVGGPFANNDTDPSFEIWSPPYLFRGRRPTIDRVQKGVAYRETFTITTPDAALIESVLLMRTPSPEHVNDSDQRSLKLEFTRRGEHTLAATAPPSGTVAPPGPYYLVVNKRSLQGPIPSVARMVEVGRTDASDAPQPFPDDPPAPSGGTASPDEDTSRAAAVRERVREVTRRLPILPGAAPAAAVGGTAPVPRATMPSRRWLLVAR